MDALPYVDTISKDEAKEVERLIAEEMKRSEKKPKDFLKEMPMIGQPNFKGSERLQKEYQRVKNGTERTTIDTTRYTLPPPSIEKQNDPEAWRRALENAQSQLEHQRLRALNLELAAKYGPEAWKLVNEQCNRIQQDYEACVSMTKQEIAEINKHRKLTQMEVGAQLCRLQKEWQQLVVKNAEILQACTKKRDTIQGLQSQLYKRQKQQ